MLQRLLRELRILRARVWFRVHGVRTGVRPLIKGKAPYLDARGAVTSIGSRAVIYGFEAPVHLRTDDGARLTIGDRLMMNSGSSIHASSVTEIGDGLKLGPFASIADTNSHELSPGLGVTSQPVHIGNEVWICRSAIVLPGVSIGDGAVVAAGAIVTSDVAAFTVVAGNPARVVRNLEVSSEPRK
ncbi:acetyltransferase [Microbacterium sp. Gd 4-13]|nr:acetyltransferase [Microbacterium sp. Gd 4-13]